MGGSIQLGKKAGTVSSQLGHAGEPALPPARPSRALDVANLAPLEWYCRLRMGNWHADQHSGAGGGGGGYQDFAGEFMILC